MRNTIKVKNAIQMLVAIMMVIVSSDLVYAQEACVVEPVPRYEDSRDCVYQPYKGENDNFYDSCYQKYLIRKNDWIQRCFNYWENRDAEKTSNSESTPTPQVIEVIKEVIVTPAPTPTPKRIISRVSPSASPESSLPPRSISPSEEDYYDRQPKEGVKGAMDSNEAKHKNLFIRVYEGVAALFKRLIN